jgi:hypothetical protein
MNAALQDAERVPPGLERAEKYLSRLKVIDTGYAPDDLKEALADYTSALEQSIDAAKAGRGTTPFDQHMAEAKQRIVAIAKRYD